MTEKRLVELDNKFLKITVDIEEFTEEDSIVRIGDFGYVTEEEYESMFENDRERKEYQALSNADISHYIYNTLDIEAKRIESLTDEELDKLLDEQITTESCEVYYTTGEERVIVAVLYRIHFSTTTSTIRDGFRHEFGYEEINTVKRNFKEVEEIEKINKKIKVKKENFFETELRHYLKEFVSENLQEQDEETTNFLVDVYGYYNEDEEFIVMDGL